MYRSIELAQALSVSPVIDAVDQARSAMEAIKPVPAEVHARIMQKLRLNWNYHSNAIEGNPFTYGETVAFLMEGVTIKGKTLKDHLDIKGHDEAIHYLLEIVKNKEYVLTEADIRNLHKMILKEPYEADAITPEGLPTKKQIKIGEYKEQSNSVRTPTGEMHYYATPQETRMKMEELINWYRTITTHNHIHPLTIAALFHHQFTAIHPFDDGNGRLARMLLNLMLMQQGYPPVVIRQQDRNNYYAVLRQADAGEYRPVVEYMAEQLLASLELYLKGARGESIEETDDIDKEIALFMKELGEDKVKEKRTTASTTAVFRQSIIPLAILLKNKLDQLKDTFFDYKCWIGYTDEQADTEGLGFYEFTELNESNPFGNTGFGRELNYKEITIKFKMIGFKKHDPAIDYFVFVNTTFSEYYYTINWSNEDSMIRKLYGNYLTKEEISDLISRLVKSLMLSMKKNLSN